MSGNSQQGIAVFREEIEVDLGKNLTIIFTRIILVQKKIILQDSNKYTRITGRTRKVGNIFSVVLYTHGHVYVQFKQI